MNAMPLVVTISMRCPYPTPAVVPVFPNFGVQRRTPKTPLYGRHPDPLRPTTGQLTSEVAPPVASPSPDVVQSHTCHAEKRPAQPATSTSTGAGGTKSPIGS